ncbi:hypothetical protein BH11BAC1_BH11BAC1_26950 [soil metagenome]
MKLYSTGVITHSEFGATYRDRKSGVNIPSNKINEGVIKMRNIFRVRQSARQNASTSTRLFSEIRMNKF